jgi:hypothetical protein
MLRSNPSEGERVADFCVDAEIQCHRGSVAGSFDKIAHAARPFAAGVTEMADGYSKKILDFIEKPARGKSRICHAKRPSWTYKLFILTPAGSDPSL